MRFFYFVITVLLIGNSFAQQADSITASKIQSINNEIDSLKTLVDSLNQKITNIEKKQVNKTNSILFLQ